MGTTKNFHLVAIFFIFGILLPILSFFWLAIGRRKNLFRQALLHFFILQHTSQEDAFTQNEHLDDSSFASLVSQLLPLKQLLNRMSQVRVNYLYFSSCRSILREENVMIE